jgi:DHA3 family macrolide efflux protein-like MFS transporter
MDGSGEAVLSKPKNVFLNYNFMLLFSGKIISQLGDNIYAFALSWYILDITKSSLQMAVFLMINSLVVALTAPFGGIIADRLNRRSILIWMDAIRGIVVILAAVLLYNHLLQIWMLYISAVFLGICGAIFSPSASAIIPNIVERNQLTQATSMDNFIGSFCTGIGLLISGFLYNFIGIFFIFIMNAISYFISGIMESCIILPKKLQNKISEGFSIASQVKKAINELYEGFKYVRNNRIVYKLTIMIALFNLIVFPCLMVYIPYIFNVILKATPFQLALSQSSGWIGIIISSLLAPLFLSKIRLKYSIFAALLTYSICTFILVTAFLPQLIFFFNNDRTTVLFCISGVILGLSMPFIFIPVNVIFQKYTSDEFRGRFWGLQSSVTSFAMPAGYIIAGFLAQRVWIGFLLSGVAILMLLVNVWITNVKEMKELKE